MSFEEEPPPEITPADPPTFSGRMGEFPLPDGRHYFSTAQDASPFVHHGEAEEDQFPILQIQDVVGAPPTAAYDAETASAVMAWREMYGAEEAEFVDDALWQRMDQTPPPGG